jgi:acetyl-CoA acetyltransferase
VRSGLQAVAAAHAIRAGEGDVFIAGGVESMSRAPYVMLKAEDGYARGAPDVADTVLGWRFVNDRMPDRYTVALGETAERVAERHGITRDAQDASRWRASAAPARRRRRAASLTRSCPSRRRRKGRPSRVDTDEHPRPDTTLEQLAKLRPAFREGGTVTAGNSSGLNDGAAALLVVEERRARELGCAAGAHRPRRRQAWSRT